MKNATILYSAEIDPFFKRVIRIFYPQLIAPGLLALFPLLNIHGSKIVYTVLYIMLLCSITILFFKSYKWALNKITLISFDNDIFSIEVISKDKKNIYKISKNNIAINLKWKHYRQYVLILKVVDSGKQIGTFYAAELFKKNAAAQLEQIAYKIEKAQCKD